MVHLQGWDNPLKTAVHTRCSHNPVLNGDHRGEINGILISHGAQPSGLNNGGK